MISAFQPIFYNLHMIKDANKIHRNRQEGLYLPFSPDTITVLKHLINRSGKECPKKRDADTTPSYPLPIKLPIMKRLVPLMLAALLVFPALEATSQINPDLADELQEIMDDNIALYGIEGVSVTVILPDGCEWNGVSGIAGPGDPADLERKWHFASITKAVTAAVVLQLHEEGILDINDPLYMFMSTDTIPYVDSTITVKRLLNQTTDLTENWGTNPNTPLWDAVWADRDSVWNIWDVLKAPYLSEPTPNPGMEHRYLSILNYMLLGFVIESATGNTLETEFQNRIFDPLEMSSSYLGTDGIDMADLNGLYNGEQYRGDWHHDSYMSTRGAGASLLSTTHDVATFFRAYHTDQLVSSEMMEEARTKTAGDPDEVPGTCMGTGYLYYGYGTHIFEFYPDENLDTIRLYGHGGQGLGSCFSFHSLDHGVTLVIAANDFTVGAVYGNLATFSKLFCHILDNMESATCLTGVEESRPTAVEIYPNPGTDLMNVVSDGSTGLESIRILSVSGEIILEESHADRYATLATGNLKAGIYFVEVRTSAGVKLYKWVKQ